MELLKKLIWKHFKMENYRKEGIYKWDFSFSLSKKKLSLYNFWGCWNTPESFFIHASNCYKLSFLKVAPCKNTDKIVRLFNIPIKTRTVLKLNWDWYSKRTEYDLRKPPPSDQIINYLLQTDFSLLVFPVGRSNKQSSA